MNKKLLSRFERDMQLRGLSPLTQEAYLNKVQKFATFLGKSPRGGERARCQAIPARVDNEEAFCDAYGQPTRCSAEAVVHRDASKELGKRTDTNG